MGAKNLSQLFSWVDSTYVVYPNPKIHTGGNMSFGYILVHCKYRKQKLNTKSSTEAELVDVRKYLPYNILIFFYLLNSKDMTSNRTYYSKITKVQ